MIKVNGKKASLISLFGVASVWFGNHAGGGFATGNQATQYYVKHGWTAVFLPLITIAIMALTHREAIIMANNHGFRSHKPLFEELFNPYKKLGILFEIYWYMIVVSATGAAIAGAATLFTEFGLPYPVAVLIIGVVLFFLTIFGSGLVAKAATVMSITILICCAIIFFLGIQAKTGEIAQIVAQQQATSANGFVDHSPFRPIWNTLTYGGFQYSVLPALISCAAFIERKKDVSKAMFFAFLLNGLALCFSCWMLIGWFKEYSVYSPTLPTLYICKQLGYSWLYYVYSAALFLCFVSTGVTVIFGVTTRFEGHKVLAKIENIVKRRAIVSLLAMSLCMAFSLIGLTNVIKYGYGYCGVIGVFVVTIPFLTIGRIKNKKFREQHSVDEDTISVTP